MSNKIQIGTSSTPDWFYLIQSNKEQLEYLKQLPGTRITKDKSLQIHRSVIIDDPQYEIVYNNPNLWGTKHRGEVNPRAFEVYENIARPYQREDAEFITSRSGAILASEVGVGKSISAALAAELTGLKPILVMGTLLSSAPWCGPKGDPKKFFNVNVIHVHGRTKTGPEVFDQPNDGWWFIHYDILKAWIPWIFTKLKPKVVIFDECHKLSPKSQRGRAAQAVSRFNGVQLRIPISATPVRNKRMDLWTPLELAAPDCVGSYVQWGSRWCGGQQGEYGLEFNGETHNEELKSRLSDVLIRRTKAEVMAYLPPIVREGNEIELDNTASEEYKKYKAAERDIRAFLEKYEGKPLAPGITGQRLIQLTKLLGILSKGKAYATADIAVDTAKANGKCVVFCWFKEVAKTISSLIAKEGVEVYGPITGDDDVKVRILKAQQFAQTDAPAVYVATLASASESINELVAAQELIINDLYWNPLLLIQAEGRLHRSGQQGSVHVLYVTAKGTIDELLLETLYKKAQAVETIGISDEAKKMVGNIGGMAPQDDMNSFVNAVSSQIKSEGYGIDDEDFEDD